MAFWSVTAATVLALAASGTPSPLYVDYQAAWHFSNVTITLVYAMYAAGVVTTLMLAGGVSDRWGRRPVLLAGTGGLLVSLVLFEAATGVGWLFAARLLQGMATGAFTGAAGAALTELHPRGDHRVAAMVNSASTSMGIAAGALLSGALAEWAPWPLRLPYGVLMVAGIVIIALLWATVPETAPLAAGGAERNSRWRIQALGVPREARPAFLTGCLGVGAAWSCGGLYLALGGSLARDLLNLQNHLVAGLVILSVQGVGGLSQLFLARMDAHAATARGCAALTAGLAVVAGSVLWSSPALFMAGDVVTGLGFGLSFMGATRMVTQAAPPDRRGQVLASYFVVAYGAISVPAIAVGAVSAAWGLQPTFYAFAAVMAVLSMATARRAASSVRDR